MAKQMVKLLIILFTGKIICQAACQHRANPLNGVDLFCIRMADFLNVIVKISADHSGIGKTDSCDSKAVDHLGKSGLFGFLKACHQVVKGLLSEAFHLYDLILIFSDFKNISQIVDKAHGNKFLQGCLGKAVNVHGIPAGK